MASAAAAPTADSTCRAPNRCREPFIGASFAMVPANGGPVVKPRYGVSPTDRRRGYSEPLVLEGRTIRRGLRVNRSTRGGWSKDLDGAVEFADAQLWQVPRRHR